MGKLAYLKQVSSSLQICSRRFMSTGMDILPYDVFKPSNQKCDNPSIIFLHGFLGSKRNNRSAGKQLASQLNTNVFIPDLRNHGKAFHAAPMNYKELSNDLFKFVEDLQASHKISEKIILVGHSMGGKLAMIFSLLNPHLVKTVVSVDNVPYRNPHNSLCDFQKFHIALREIEFCIKKYPSLSIEQLKTHLLKWVEPNTHIVDYYLNNVTSNKGLLTPKVPIHLLRDSIEDILEWRLEEFGDLEPYANQKNTPSLLLIRATKSEFVGDNLDTKQMTKWFPTCKTVDIDSSHWIVTEKRDEFVNVTQSWIKSQL